MQAYASCKHKAWSAASLASFDSFQRSPSPARRMDMNHKAILEAGQVYGDVILLGAFVLQELMLEETAL